MAYVEPSTRSGGDQITTGIYNQDIVENEIALKALIDAATASAIPTGIVQGFVGVTAPDGWVRGSGLTIGDASSGATERANADCETLFTLLWNSMSDTEAPVSAGRGASAAADWARHARITLPDLRGRVIAALDNLGGSAASRLTSGGSGVAGETLGASGGAETHTVTASETAAHTHTGTATAGGAHTHTVTAATGDLMGYQDIPQVLTYSWAYSALTSSSSGAHTHSVSVPAGSATAHLNTQPTLVLTLCIKL